MTRSSSVVCCLLSGVWCLLCCCLLSVVCCPCTVWCQTQFPGRVFGRRANMRPPAARGGGGRKKKKKKRCWPCHMILKRESCRFHSFLPSCHSRPRRAACPLLFPPTIPHFASLAFAICLRVEYVQCKHVLTSAHGRYPAHCSYPLRTDECE